MNEEDEQMIGTRTERRGTAATSRRLALAVAIALAVTLVAAQPARGGVYRATQCHPGHGSSYADARFWRSSNHYRGSAGCGPLGAGLAIDHHAQSTDGGKLGAWSVNAPSGARIVAFNASVAGVAKGGHEPELVVGRGSDVDAAGSARGARHWESWSGEPASYMAARLHCDRGTDCGPGREAFVAIKRLTISLDDLVSPRISPTGSLLAGGSRRGTHTLGAIATDAGSGVHRIGIQVNGGQVAHRTSACQLVGEIATRVAPCPAGSSAAVSVDTDEAPFRHGANAVLACVADYAPGGTSNRTCARRAVRVDRLCPLAGAAGGRSLAIEVRRRGRGGSVRGTLRDADGAPVAGATVCVATRVALRGTGERVEATPTTDGDGRFTARLDEGPSREVRLAYWASSSRAVERFGRLDIPARPRLRLRPRGELRNGDRVRFRVRLHGPAAGGREAKVQVRANKRWLDLRSGRTNARGRYRARYRFRATTGRRRYRFRALVPRQDGYPYTRGHSKVRRKVVTG